MMGKNATRGSRGKQKFGPKLSYFVNEMGNSLSE